VPVTRRKPKQTIRLGLDIDECQRFVDAVWPDPSGWVDVVQFDDFGKKTDYGHVPVADLINWIRTRYARSVSVGIATHRPLDPRRPAFDWNQSLASAQAYWVDLDCYGWDDRRRALDQLREMEPTPQVIVESGHGLHAYWLLGRPVPLDTPAARGAFEAILKGLALELAAADATRTMRLPGTLNCPNKQKKRRVGIKAKNCKRVQLDDRVRYAPEAFLHFAGSELAGPGFVRVDQLEDEAVRWLWPGYLPIGKLTLLDGAPGAGKSLIAVDLAARLTRGRPWPDGAPSGDPTGVVFCGAENGPADTLKPRLLAAGADVARIQAFHQEEPLDLTGDLRHLRRAVRAVGAQLAVVDPLLAFLPGGTRHTHVRQALVPILRFAREESVALLAVRNLTPGQERGAAAAALSAVAPSRLRAPGWRGAADRRRRRGRGHPRSRARCG